jgi:hypothetical protein
MFVKEMSATVSANQPNQDLTFKELQSILAEMFNSLSPESKEEYREKRQQHFDDINKAFIGYISS